MSARRGRGAALALASAILLGGCGDLLLTEPQPAPAGLAMVVSFASSAGADAGRVLRQADRLRVQLLQGDGTVLATESFPLAFDGNEARFRLPVDLDQARADVLAEFLVEMGGEVLFGAAETLTLVRGETTAVTPVLDPEIGMVTVEGPSRLVALGDTASFSAATFYATGDTLSGTVSFESLDPGVLQRISATRFRAVGAGVARLRIVGSAGVLEAEPEKGIHQVTVDPEPAEVVLSPASVDLGVNDTASVQATVRDRNGNALSEAVQWSSNNPSVALVFPVGASGAADVIGVAAGTAVVEARAGSVVGRATVTVGEVLGTGDVQVTLTWDNTSDMDLYVTDPLGETVWYGNSTSTSGGRLDVDDTSGFGPENVFWPSGGAPAGLYVVEVDHYSGASPTGVQVRVRSRGEEKTYSATIGGGTKVEIVRFVLGQPLPASATPTPTGPAPAGAKSGH